MDSAIAPSSFKASETLLGIETLILVRSDRKAAGFKASETLLGIETSVDWADTLHWFLSFKASETLLGIETLIIDLGLNLLEASKPLKPF